MTFLDWAIVVVMVLFMLAAAVVSRSYSKSVADFLAAGRTAGRYVLTMSQGAAELGAITIVAYLEMNYVAGFSMSWWGMTTNVIVLIITISGWVIYRFRQTRALTLAEFFERRYSRRFRVFAGLVAFTSGIVNFGIFPAVGARFFIYFCDLPQQFAVAGLTISTYPLVMILLLATALFFVFAGGQVAVILADFVQGLFFNVVFVAISAYLLVTVDWATVIEALSTAPENASLINPYKTSHVEDFNFVYFMIGIVGVIYGTMSWQGVQGYQASAKSAHEAKMAAVLSNFRWFPRNLMIIVLPVTVYAVMHHADFAAQAAEVQQALDAIDNEAVQSQMRAPLVLRGMLPTGLLGAFAAVMLACFISTHDTYLHSWGSIFIQDVVMPLRGKRLTEKQHLRLLRGSIAGVAVFIFLFSLLFRQSEYIFLFFAITGAIFAGGSGAVIIGGLYWRRGTTAAAWTAMILGSAVAVGGIVVHQIDAEFFINGQVFWAIAMATASLSYVLVSLAGPRKDFDLDRLLHRGKHAIADETKVVNENPGVVWKLLGMGREFTKGDRAVFVIAYAWTIGWTIAFIVGTIYNLTHDVADASWAAFWKFYVWLHVVVSAVVLVWFSIGGVRDAGRMLERLRVMHRDPDDDGLVQPGDGEC